MQLVSDDLKEVLRILESTLSKATHTTPYLRDEIYISVSAEISNLLKEVNNCRSQKYKRARLEAGLHELSQKLPMIPYRNIAKDEKERKKAVEQYAGIQALLREKTTPPLKELDKLTATILRDSLCSIFDKVQNDLFYTGYGNPLTSQEYKELTQMVVDAIDESVQFSRRFKETGVPSGEICNISQISRKYSEKISEFLLKRDSTIINGILGTISQIVNNDSTFRFKLQQQLMNAEQEEINSMITNAREEGERMLRENDPAAIDNGAGGRK